MDVSKREIKGIRRRKKKGRERERERERRQKIEELK